MILLTKTIVKLSIYYRIRRNNRFKRLNVFYCYYNFKFLIFIRMELLFDLLYDKINIRRVYKAPKRFKVIEILKDLKPRKKAVKND